MKVLGNMSNKTYDILNDVVKLLLPALGTAYFALAQLLGLPGGEKVVGALAIIATFLGVVLTIAKKAYNTIELPYDPADSAEADRSELDILEVDEDESFEDGTDPILCTTTGSQ